VTQFEAVTATAFVALASAGVELGVIEAGLGGRLDATNVLPSGATALTSVGLEHTEWLGETEEAIATEKLAVLRDHSTLVVGRLDEGIRELAERTAAERSARLIVAGDPDPGLRLSAPGAYQRRNFAVATDVAEVTLGALDPTVVRAVAEGLELPGRVQLLEGDPPLILDAAHNPDGAQALAEALPEAAGEAPVVACLAILADKDAAGVLAALAPRLVAAVCTELPSERLARVGRPSAATVEAPRLAALARGAGLSSAEAVPQPGAALGRARELARRQGGIALVTGSHYLLPYA
jgi:dihydrofolate synthase/folylpolyglutamate synthase